MCVWPYVCSLEEKLLGTNLADFEHADKVKQHEQMTNALCFFYLPLNVVLCRKRILLLDSKGLVCKSRAAELQVQINFC
jgi:hypothetical protein